MAFDVIASSYREKEKQRGPVGQTVMAGLIFGGAAVFFAMVGILAMFHERPLIDQVITLAEAWLIVFAMWAGMHVARNTNVAKVAAIGLQGAGAGAGAGIVVGVLALIMKLSNFGVREMFVALSPELFDMLTFDRGLGGGLAVLITGGAVSGLLGAMLYRLPRGVQHPLVVGLAWMVFLGLFQELIQLLIQDNSMDPVREAIFTWDGLRLQGAIGTLIVVGSIVAIWDAKRERLRERFGQLPAGRQKGLRLGGLLSLLFVALILFPFVAGNFIGQVLLFIGLFILMGMGLNLEVGLAGLLDLGFVAFYAVGAYTCALLTADSPYALHQQLEWFPAFGFWEAMVASVVMSILVGVMFGVPVLKVRGDYLAVATMGLGEIVRVLVLSDLAKPVLGASVGVLDIPPPYVGQTPLDDPIELYYVALAAAGVAAYFAWRLENSRLGRAWTAIRDDEDVAQALGINLINVKLLAYGLGAAFAGLAGAIFATNLTSIYPHSFQLIISVNVLALIIVGGMGSLPGVVVGALALIGLPELLREFGEYRFLFYGIAIVAVMRIKPGGLWPSEARRREMRTDADTRAAIEAGLAGVGRGATAVPSGPSRQHDSP